MDTLEKVQQLFVQMNHDRREEAIKTKVQTHRQGGLRWQGSDAKRYYIFSKPKSVHRKHDPIQDMVWKRASVWAMKTMWLPTSTSWTAPTT